MKRLLFVIAALFFLVTSCSKSRPKGILSDKEMSELMTEVYILDSYLNNLPADSGRKVMPVLYQQLFDKFDMDSTVFTKNLDYYYGNPVELEKVNTRVKDVLGRYEKEALRTDSIEQAHIRDSTNRVLRLQQWAGEMKRLIVEVYLDTTEYTFGMNNSVFFQHVPVQVHRHELIKPMSKEHLEAESSAEKDENDTPVVVDSTLIDSTKRVERQWQNQDSTFRKLGIKEIRRKPLWDKIKQRLAK